MKWTKPYAHYSFNNDQVIHAMMNAGVGLSICDRAWENRSYLHILYFENYEFEILNTLFFSCGAIQSRQSYHFIAISTSYLNAAGFLNKYFHCL